MMKRWLLWLLTWLHLSPKSEFTSTLVRDNPPNETVTPGRMIIVGGPGYQKWVYFRCPCRCGELIMLPLVQSRRPRWSVSIDWFNRPTIEPSVRQTAGCFSHFWIRRGVVDWCDDTGRQWS
jgi:hypothetical protein